MRGNELRSNAMLNTGTAAYNYALWAGQGPMYELRECASCEEFYPWDQCADDVCDICHTRMLLDKIDAETEEEQ